MKRVQRFCLFLVWRSSKIDTSHQNLLLVIAIMPVCRSPYHSYTDAVTHTRRKNPCEVSATNDREKTEQLKKNVADDIEKQTTSNRFGYIFASSFYWLVSLFICSSSGVVLRHSVIDKQLCYSRWIVSTIKQFDDLTDLQNVIVHTIKNVSGWSARKILSHKPHNDTLPTYTTNQTQRQKTIRIDCVAILWMGAKHSR